MPRAVHVLQDLESPREDNLFNEVETKTGVNKQNRNNTV
jgi:hypothetical protein